MDRLREFPRVTPPPRRAPLEVRVLREPSTSGAWKLVALSTSLATVLLSASMVWQVQRGPSRFDVQSAPPPAAASVPPPVVEVSVAPRAPRLIVADTLSQATIDALIEEGIRGAPSSKPVRWLTEGVLFHLLAEGPPDDPHRKGLEAEWERLQRATPTRPVAPVLAVFSTALALEAVEPSSARPFFLATILLDPDGPTAPRARSGLERLQRSRRPPSPITTLSLAAGESTMLNLDAVAPAESVEALLIDDAECVGIVPHGRARFEVVGRAAGTTLLVFLTRSGEAVVWRIQVS